MLSALGHLILVAAILLSSSLYLGATRLESVRQVDKDYLMVHFEDGIVLYRDDATGPGAYQGHYDAPGDDTLKFYGKPLDVVQAVLCRNWKIYSPDDEAYSRGVSPLAIWRKSKSLSMAQNHDYALDHQLFLSLPTPLKDGCSYMVKVSGKTNSQQSEASFRHDIFSSPSEAVHVNIIGYMPRHVLKAADLYLWLGDGGERETTLPSRGRGSGCMM